MSDVRGQPTRFVRGRQSLLPLCRQDRPARYPVLASLVREAEAALYMMAASENPPPLSLESEIVFNVVFSHSFRDVSQESLDFVYRAAKSRVLLSSLLQR